MKMTGKVSKYLTKIKQITEYTKSSKIIMDSNQKILQDFCRVRRAFYFKGEFNIMQITVTCEFFLVKHSLSN